MKNILLVFLNELGNINDFNEIIDKFVENNYAMYLLDNIKEDEYFSIDSLPELVEFYKRQHDNVNKVVALSNSRDLIFSWYRCYNSVVDDFIYFIDEDDKNYFDSKDRHYEFYKGLFEFDGIEKETVDGKIYINIDFNNYSGIINFLIQDSNFRYFNNFIRYDFNLAKADKISMSKKYIFDGFEYSFAIDNKSRLNTIRILETDKKKNKINDDFIKHILNNIYLIPYITVLFYKTQEQTLTSLLLIIYKNLKKADKQHQKDIFEQLYSYINNNNIDFKEKKYISSLLVTINNGDERLTECMMKTLLEDYEYLEYHCEVIANILFYGSNEDLKKHFNYYSDLRSEIGRLAKWVSRGLEVRKTNVNICSKKIAIIVDQLLSLNHSPTKLMLDYAKNIRKYYPEYTVKIFVEDTLYCKNELGIIPYLYTSAVSKSVEAQHRAYLNEDMIDISYANVHLRKKDRTIKLTKELEDFSPDAILTNSDISLLSRIFYNIYPIIYMSMGGDYFSTLADVYLCISKEKVIEENLKYKLFNEDKLYDYKYGLEFCDPKKEVKRTDYNIKENDFVMITVGNRLGAEMDEEFIDNITKFIKFNEDTKWLIVGPNDIPYLAHKYPELLNNQIINIKYESDLAALYRICDTYINPRRKGGGISIAMAMNEGLPVVLTKDSTDGVRYAGKDYAVNNIKEYLLYLEELKKRKDYKEFVSKEMIKRVSKFTMRDALKVLFDKLTSGNYNEILNMHL